MRCFLHISEFGFEGYRYLPGLAAISDDLVLWAPAALQAEQARKAGASLLGAEELLGLVEAGRVRIVGREHYLMEKDSRENGWTLAEWTTTFDTEIAAIAAKDLNRPPERRRVFFAEPEQGESWARQELAAQSSRSRQVEDLIFAPGALDPGQSRLLPGLVEKLSRLESREEQLELALRDIRNHTLATDEVEADFSVEPLAFREIVADLGNHRQPETNPAPPPPTLDGFRELLDIVMSLAPLESAADVRRLLDLKELPVVRFQIESLLRFTPRPKERLGEELEEAGELSNWFSTLMDSPAPKGAFLMDLMGVALALIIEQPELALLGPMTRLGGAVAQAAQREADRESSLQSRIPYGGISLPFILAFGDETVTFHRIGEIKRRLEDSHRNGLI